MREVLFRYRFRLAILIIITAAQYSTYGMIAYYTPYASGFAYGIEVAPLNIAIANAGASIGAFLLIPLMDRSRKISTLLSYLGGTVSAAFLTAIHGSLPLGVFLATVFINMVFSEWAWASLSALESELFPTGVRASTIGFITLVNQYINNSYFDLRDIYICTAISFNSINNMGLRVGSISNMVP